MKNVLVSGASSGFGALIARGLVAAGHTVVGTSRRATQPASISPGEYTQAQLDVDCDNSVQQFKEHLHTLGFTPDVLILNAGFGVSGSLEETSTATAKRQFETNFFGVHRMINAFLPLLRQQSDARVIVIGSLAGIFGIPFQGMYCASKFALEGYVETLRMEAGIFGVQVCLVQPGDYRTAFTENRDLPAAAPDSPYQPVLDQTLAIIAGHEREGGDPQVVADKVVALVTQRKLKTRYPLGSFVERSIAAMAGVLPDALLQSVLRSVYRIPRG